MYAKNVRHTIVRPYEFVFRYMIQVNHAVVPCSKFPKHCPGWTPACQLVEPDISQPICADSTIRFCVDIPGALGVAVNGPNSTGNDEWTTLEKRGRLWTGEVKTRNAGDMLELSAKFKKDSSSFSCLLEFEVSGSPAMTQLIHIV